MSDLGLASARKSHQIARVLLAAPENMQHEFPSARLVLIWSACSLCIGPISGWWAIDLHQVAEFIDFVSSLAVQATGQHFFAFGQRWPCDQFFARSQWMTSCCVCERLRRVAAVKAVDVDCLATNVSLDNVIASVHLCINLRCAMDCSADYGVICFGVCLITGSSVSVLR